MSASVHEIALLEPDEVWRWLGAVWYYCCCIVTIYNTQWKSKRIFRDCASVYLRFLYSGNKLVHAHLLAQPVRRPLR